MKIEATPAPTKHTPIRSLNQQTLEKQTYGLINVCPKQRNNMINRSESFELLISLFYRVESNFTHATRAFIHKTQTHTHNSSCSCRSMENKSWYVLLYLGAHCVEFAVIWGGVSLYCTWVLCECVSLSPVALSLVWKLAGNSWRGVTLFRATRESWKLRKINKVTQSNRLKIQELHIDFIMSWVYTCWHNCIRNPRLFE